MALVIVGQTPDALHHAVRYVPTLNELLVTAGVYAIGFFIITVLYKVALSIREKAV